MQLVPLKVKIGLKESGGAKYPEFNVLQCVKDSKTDWSCYVDCHGTGWTYDCCGHCDQEPDSPFGIQWGMISVPKIFADQAVAEFPSDVAKMTDTEAEEFYNNCCARDLPDEDIDIKVLDAIKRKKDMGVDLTPMQIKAIDPQDDTRGIRPNKDKTWPGFKQKRGVTIVQ